MASVHEVIEAFRKVPSNSERGTRFKQLMGRNFQLDPMLSRDMPPSSRGLPQGRSLRWMTGYSR